jgi:NADH-quinone oxidoreductase subunit E
MSDFVQPSHFAFDAESEAAIPPILAKYPAGKQASAVLPMLYLVQNQMKRQTGSAWVPTAGMDEVARRLDMAPIRVYEVATFYFMFNLSPIGKWHLQVCTTTPCWLRGSDDVVAACKKHIAPTQHTVSADGKFSWMEVECLGACVNAPMLQIGKDFYEDLDGPTTEKILEAFRGGKTPTPGPQNGRRSSEPIGGATTLLDVPKAKSGAPT